MHRTTIEIAVRCERRSWIAIIRHAARDENKQRRRSPTFPAFMDTLHRAGRRATCTLAAP
jgi:hypothetical protein